MVIHSLLSHNSNKSLQRKKTEVKRVRIILSILDAMLIMLIVIPIVLATESNDIYAAEFCWPSKAKSYSCDSLKPIHKNGQQENKFTFDVAKCDKIFDELHKVGCIKMSHLYLL
jgi:hypothetical protein